MKDEDIFGFKSEELFKQLRSIANEHYSRLKSHKLNDEFCDDFFRTTRNAFHDKKWLLT